MDNKELEKIYEESYRAVYWTAMSLLKDEDEAQDIVQETYVSLISSYSSIRDKDKVYGWLKKTAANKSLNRLTRTKTVNTGDEFLETVEALPEDFLPDSIVESDEKRKIIMDIIDNSLSEDIRTTLVLYYFDEMSTKEIASALGIPQGTVLWRLSFAKKKIKQEVETYEKDNNDKLYAMAIPFLTKLFTAEADSVPIRPMPASLIPSSASAELPGGAASKEVSGASRTAAKKASASSSSKVVAKKGMSALSKKVLIGVVSSVLAVAVIVAIVRHINVEDPHYVAHTTVPVDQVSDEQVTGDTLSDDQIASNGISSDIEPSDPDAPGSDVDAASDADYDPYRVALMAILNDQVLPDGSTLELEEGSTLRECKFEVYDIDSDGIDELFIDYVPGYGDTYPGGFVSDTNRSTYVFEYDPESDTWELEFRGNGLGFVYSNGSYGDNLLCTVRYEDTHVIYDWYSMDSEPYVYVGSVEEFHADTYAGDFPAEYASQGVAYIVNFPGYDGGFISETDYMLSFYEVEIGDSLMFVYPHWYIDQEVIDEFIDQRNSDTGS